MQLAPVSSDTQTTSTTKAHGFSGLGENDFLQLFITKMQNQDPLSPADDQALVAQLAQFSTLEQQVQSKDLLSQLVASQQSASSARLVDLLGRGALVTGVPAHVTGGASEPLSAQLGGDATKVQVEIVDGSGAIVRTLDLGAHAAGRVVNQHPTEQRTSHQRRRAIEERARQPVPRHADRGSRRGVCLTTRKH